MSGDTVSDPGGTSEGAFVVLAVVVVVVDGVYGLAYAGYLDAAPDPLLFALPSAARYLPLLVLAAVAAAAVAAGTRSPGYAALVVAVGVPLVAVHAVTVHVLPWDQTAFWIARSLLDVLLGLPGGEFLARAVFGSSGLGPATLRRAFLYHYAVVGVLAAAAAAVAGRRGVGRRIPRP